MKRAKEIGVKKVLGSSRVSLILSSLSETGMITSFSIILSLGLAEIFLININHFIPIESETSLLREALSTQPIMYIFLIGLSLTITLIAGLYPALILSGYNPVNALKSKITGNNGKGVMLRRGLVIFQFVISQILIMGTVVVMQQMYFIQNKDLGFEKDAVVTIGSPEGSFAKQETLKNELIKNFGYRIYQLFSKSTYFQR